MMSQELVDVEVSKSFEKSSNEIFLVARFAFFLPRVDSEDAVEEPVSCSSSESRSDELLPCKEDGVCPETGQAEDLEVSEPVGVQGDG